VCDLLVVNLRTACETQQNSNEIRFLSKMYAYNGMMDSNRAENPQINSINIQMQRVNEFRAMLQNYLTKSENDSSQQQQQQQQAQNQNQPQLMNIN
jgi:hypothetical protein